ncbi:MAG: cystathionine beta-lyase [Pseudomonadota bacterium]
MNKQKSDGAIATRSVHNARDPSIQNGMVNTPVYHASTIIHDTVNDLENAKLNINTKDALIYGRLGTPTTFAFENSVADLEGGYGALAVSSGLAAITTAIMAFVRSGDHILVANSVYYPTRHFCDYSLQRVGVDVTYYDPSIGDSISTLFQENTRLIFMESPGSNTFIVQDVPAIAEVAAASNIVTILDNSWASPIFFRPLEHGVNVCVVAATKYLSGHSDTMLGVIIADESHYPAVRNCRDEYGQCVGPDDLYLGLRGIRTLATRMQQHDRSGRAIAQWLSQQPGVLRVLHPALPDSIGHEIWKRDFDGASGLFGFELESRSRDAAVSMLEGMRYFAMGFSWGGFESLLIPVDSSGGRKSVDWSSDRRLFRIHVGLEDVSDLIADLESGLQRYFDCNSI